MDDTFFQQKKKQNPNQIQAQPGLGGSPAVPGQGMQRQAPAAGGPNGQSTGSAGTGFVNLSQMLSLNKGSGRQSANALAKGATGAGEKAQTDLGNMMGQFNQASVKGAYDPTKVITYDANGNPNFAGGTAGLETALSNAKVGYTGPESLSAMKGYSDLQKSLLGAGETAGNLAKGGQGMASEIGKQTGLSPTQSAAGAFYMGVNNPYIKQAGSDYKDLGNKLDAANAESMQTAQLARQRSNDAIGQLEDYQKKAKDYYAGIDTANANETTTRNAQTAKDQNDAATAKVNQGSSNPHDETHDPDAPQLESNYYEAVRKGVPGNVAYHGITYDQWLAAGSPEDWDAYLAATGGKK